MTAVGIDVGKASLDVAIDGAPGVVRFANSAAGVGKLKEQCAHRHRFENQQHASRMISDWIQFYNHRRPTKRWA